MLIYHPDGVKSTQCQVPELDPFLEATQGSLETAVPNSAWATLRATNNLLGWKTVQDGAQDLALKCTWPVRVVFRGIGRKCKIVQHRNRVTKVGSSFQAQLREFDVLSV